MWKVGFHRFFGTSTRHSRILFLIPELPVLPIFHVFLCLHEANKLHDFSNLSLAFYAKRSREPRPAVVDCENFNFSFHAFTDASVKWEREKNSASGVHVLIYHPNHNWNAPKTYSSSHCMDKHPPCHSRLGTAFCIG